MCDIHARRDDAIDSPGARTLDMKLEVLIPVSDAERAKRFYDGLDWRLDADIVMAGAALVKRGVDVSGILHRAAVAEASSSGPDPARQTAAR